MKKLSNFDHFYELQSQPFCRNAARNEQRKGENFAIIVSHKRICAPATCSVTPQAFTALNDQKKSDYDNCTGIVCILSLFFLYHRYTTSSACWWNVKAFWLRERWTRRFIVVSLELCIEADDSLGRMINNETKSLMCRRRARKLTYLLSFKKPAATQISIARPANGESCFLPPRWRCEHIWWDLRHSIRLCIVMFLVPCPLTVARVE